MKFCVECGSEEKIFGKLCMKCLLSKNLVRPPQYAEVFICQDCGAVLDGAIWTEIYPRERVRKSLATSTKKHVAVSSVEWVVPEFSLEKGEHQVECKTVITVEGERLELAFPVLVRMRHQICQSCSRQRGDYYEAVLQLRSNLPEEKDEMPAILTLADERILELVESLGKGDKNAFISKSARVKGGIDYYIGSGRLAKSMAKRMKESMACSIAESSSLVGMKEGRELYRWTILVRLPLIKTGDIVEFKKRLYEVDSMGKKNLVLRDLHTSQKSNLKSPDKLKLVASREKLEEALVVSQSENDAQILDPGSMKTITVIKPAGRKKLGENVEIVRFKGEMIIV
jgi:nonsense-mediated mRNA decay protein 3